MKINKWILSILTILFSANVFAYKIIVPDIHESMTRSSKACFDKAMTTKTEPKDCLVDLNIDNIEVWWMEDSSLAFYDVLGWIKRGLNYTADLPDLEDAVRWPDDPTKEISAGILKIGSKLLTDTCESYRDAATGIIDLNAGLICVSHYGELQFLHAQASSVGEPASDTHNKIISWASFLYLVASRKLSNEDLNEDYCTYFSEDSLFNRAMLPSNLSTPCTSNKGKWKVSSLFNITCSSPKPSAWGCNEWVGDASYDKARIMATGALLHLVQDSFSQSHAERGACEIEDNKVVAKVECKPVSRFTTYKGQENHADADFMPQFKSSCAESEMIDDPILAGAKILWYIENAESLDDFKTNVIYKVFGTPEYVVTHGEPAGLGQCFVNKL